MFGILNNMKEIDYTQAFLRVANTYPEFKEAIDIVKSNSEGKIWLIGGFVCRCIIQDLYNVKMPEGVDLDFIVEKTSQIKLPIGWEIRENSYGNPKFVGLKYEIDCVPLNNIHSIIRRNLEPTIENFLLGTPLNVQSIVYDITNNIVVGDIGTRSIQEKIVSVNDIEQAKHRAKKKGVGVDDLVTDIAQQFGFNPVYFRTEDE